LSIRKERACESQKSKNFDRWSHWARISIPFTMGASAAPVLNTITNAPVAFAVAGKSFTTASRARRQSQRCRNWKALVRR
jgi:hypothetical protein